MRAKIIAFAKKHWKELIGYLSGAFTYLFDKVWLELLPLPAELSVRGMVFVFVMMAIAVVLSGYVLYRIKAKSDYVKVKISIICMVFFAVLFFGFYSLFFVVEGWWKRPDVPFEIIYFTIEPLVFSLAFSSVAGGFVHLLNAARIMFA